MDWWSGFNGRPDQPGRRFLLFFMPFWWQADGIFIELAGDLQRAAGAVSVSPIF